MFAVYKHYNDSGEVLYIGMSVSLFQRIETHACSSHWFEQVEKITIDWFDTKEGALRAESESIEAECPKYNKVSVQGDLQKIHHKLEKMQPATIAGEKLKRLMQYPHKISLNQVRYRLQCTREEVFELVSSNKMPSQKIIDRASMFLELGIYPSDWSRDVKDGIPKTVPRIDIKWESRND